MSVHRGPHTIRYHGSAAAAVKPVTARTQPHYMGMIIAGGLLYLMYPAQIDTAALFEPGPDLYTAIALTAGLFLLPMSCLHFSISADPTGRTITRRRHFLWIPLWSRTWSFDDILGYVIKRPGMTSRDLDTSQRITGRSYHGGHSGGGWVEIIYFAGVILFAVVTLIWDLVTPYKLYFLTDRGRYLAATGMHQGSIGNLGRKLGRMAGVRCH